MVKIYVGIFRTFGNMRYMRDIWHMLYGGACFYILFDICDTLTTTLNNYYLIKRYEIMFFLP